MYVKMKELGPVGGVHRARPLDQPMSRTHIVHLARLEQHNLTGDTKHKIVVLMQKYPTFMKYVG